MEAAPTSIIVDCGSGTTKAGIGGETIPRSVFPTLIGKPKSTSGMPLMAGKAEYVGDEAMSKKGILRLEFPVENGVIKNWDAIMSIWTHTFFNEVRLAPEEHPVLMTDANQDPKINKEKTAQLLFEKMKVPSLFLVNPGILSLYANGIITGVAVDVGDCLTLCVPGDEGMADTNAIRKRYFGGRQLTDYLTRLLNERGNLFESSGEQYTVKSIKEQACLIALDPKEAEKTTPPFEYTLPDGNKLSLTNERFKCPELFFNPALGMSKSEESLPQFVMGSIMKCDETLRKSLLTNLVLAGGSMSIPGAVERMSKELKALSPEGLPIEVKAAKNPKYSAWIGGSIMSSLSTFKHMWLTKAEYQESGASVVATKFPV